jgi:type IV pilus assembly protein PilC
VIGLSDSLTNNWHLYLGGLVAFLVTMKYYLGTDNGRKMFDMFILRAPMIGDVMSKIAVGRFCSTMATMLSSGVNIMESLTICAAASGNKKIETFILNVKDQISKGSSFADPLSEGDLIPMMVVSMVAVGESTGTLDESLNKVSQIYEEEVDTAVAAMMAMLEPVMIVVIGSVVGFIVIAMYLPIFGMASTV